MKKIKMDYYDEFIKNTEFAVEIAKMLDEYADNFEANKVEEIEKEVHKIENEADQNLHEITNYLVNDFLPPIESEDIITLSNRIDDVIDCIDEVVINIDIFNVTKLRSDFKDFSELIYKTCVNLKKLIDNLKNLKEYEENKKIVVEINRLEEIGDSLYQKAIKNLYKFDNNPIDVSAWTIIYNSLENCFDSCESVAACVEEIILKNT